MPPSAAQRRLPKRLRSWVAPDFPLQVVRGLGLPGQLLVETSGIGTSQVTAWLAANPAIEYFQADGMLHAQAAPNDPLYAGQIGLHNTGQNGGTAGADIDADLAWDITPDRPASWWP